LPARERLDDIAGWICEAILPIRDEYFVGGGKSVAVCTLSSMDLLERISQMSSVMDRVAVVGRLLSENRGIDAIIKFAIDHPGLERILVCGKEVKGHLAGQALVSLAKNGIDHRGKIVGALGPYPTLRSSPMEVAKFRERITVIDRVGLLDAEKIAELVP
jgi:tetrahydromethanopterin S-methyltransferase subunit A